MISSSGIALGLLSVFLFGLRHGVDYDHIAAITDITSGVTSPKRSMKLGLLYALGHGFVVTVLGVLAIQFREYLPKSVDGLMERAIGATLILLSVYVFMSLFRKTAEGEHYRIETRFILIANLLYRVWQAIYRFATGKRLDDKKLFAEGYGAKSVFVIGMIHGVGAETPTQLGLFLFAAGIGGSALALTGVGLFVLGVIVTNTIMCAVTTGLFHIALSREALYRRLAGVTAAYSLVVGTLFLLGGSGLLPAL